MAPVTSRTIRSQPTNAKTRDPTLIPIKRGGEPSDTVAIVLDQPAESDDKFELVSGDGSYAKTLAASDAQDLAPGSGEKVLRFDGVKPNKGYKLFHKRSKGSKRVVFLEWPFAGLTEAGHPPLGTQGTYATLPSQMPSKLPDQYGGDELVDEDLVARAPVLLDLEVEDPPEL